MLLSGVDRNFGVGCLCANNKCCGNCYAGQESFDSTERTCQVAGTGERTYSAEAGSNNLAMHASVGESASSSEGTQGENVTTWSSCMPVNCPLPLLPAN
jgi:hypothetical protein